MMHQGEHIASVVFFLITYDSNLKVKKYQTNPVREPSYNITDKYPCQRQGKMEELFKFGGD